MLGACLFLFLNSVPLDRYANDYFSLSCADQTLRPPVPLSSLLLSTATATTAAIYHHYHPLNSVHFHGGEYVVVFFISKNTHTDTQTHTAWLNDYDDHQHRRRRRHRQV